MDKFVTVTKRKRPNEDQSDTIDNESNSVINNDVPNSTATLNISAEQIREPTARKFKTEWESLYFVHNHQEKPLCLICQIQLAENKAYNVRKHFESSHSEYNAKYPLDSKGRVEEIKRLKSIFISQKKNIASLHSTTELVTLASYKTSFILARKSKCYVDGEVVKEIMICVMETLLENYAEKTRKDLMQKVNNLQLSHQTVARRIEDIGKDLKNQLIKDLSDCVSFSLALDESTDVCDISQLILWVRYVTKDYEVREEFLTIHPLTGQTRGSDIFQAFKLTVEHFELNLQKLASVTSDGAPAMVGCNIGFVAFLKRYLSENNFDGFLCAYHCIIHQESLSAKVLGSDADEVMKVVVKVRYKLDHNFVQCVNSSDSNNECTRSWPLHANE